MPEGTSDEERAARQYMADRVASNDPMGTVYIDSGGGPGPTFTGSINIQGSPFPFEIHNTQNLALPNMKLNRHPTKPHSPPAAAPTPGTLRDAIDQALYGIFEGRPRK